MLSRLSWDGWILTANDEWHMVCHGMIPTYITSNPNTYCEYVSAIFGRLYKHGYIYN